MLDFLEGLTLFIIEVIFLPFKVVGFILILVFMILVFVLAAIGRLILAPFDL